MIVLLILAGIRYHQYLNPSTIASFVDKYGIMAPFLFIVLCGVKPILFFLPIMGLAIVAGMLFGPLKGAIYVSIGGAFSTIVGFYFARWIGRDMIKRIGTISKKVKQIDEWAKEHGKNAVFSMRCFNLPWDIVSYWAGLSSIKFRDFYIASIIPLVPISFLYTYFGSKILTPKSWGFVISLSIIFALGATPFIKQRLKRNS
ncbi:MAG: TVP38/TMEM64 family protein [Candidatus Omnitrophica bacterium]|nr:TVP38/TMEM64 family protein [Candidatus Omnitrophota bacterium]